MRARNKALEADFGGVIALNHKEGLARLSGDGFALSNLETWCGQALLGFVRKHACIGARALAGNSTDRNKEDRDPVESDPHAFFYGVYPDMDCVESAIQILTDLERYFQLSDSSDEIVKTFVAIFPNVYVSSQDDFSQRYWKFAQILSDLSQLSHHWDPTVGSMIEAADFELSLAGRAMFTTTLNPSNPRISRRFYYPAWVFNQKSQFDALRSEGRFESWQQSIRTMDAKLDPSGVANPILTDHGTASAAHQLAGSSMTGSTFSAPKDLQEILSRGDQLLLQMWDQSAPRTCLLELQERLDSLRARL